MLRESLLLGGSILTLVCKFYGLWFMVLPSEQKMVKLNQVLTNSAIGYVLALNQIKTKKKSH